MPIFIIYLLVIYVISRNGIVIIHYPTGISGISHPLEIKDEFTITNALIRQPPCISSAFVRGRPGGD